MMIDTSKLKISTKALVSGFIGLGGLAQIPAVNIPLTAFLTQHPKIAPLVASALGVWTVLHNPQVEDFLGIKTTTEVKQTTEEVTLTDEAGK